MKKKVVEDLVCPGCHADLECTIFSQEEEEIIDGILQCSNCAEVFPVIEGVPSMLLAPSRDLYKDEFGAFYNKYSDRIPKDLLETVGGKEKFATKKKRATQESFSFEWEIFNKILPAHENEFLDTIYPLGKDFFKEKVILDAGCGQGRFSYLSSQYGAKEVFAIDFSHSVKAAYQNNRDLKNVHVIQADIYHLPFKRKFDFVFSIGVLHHLPNPRAGFKNLLKYLTSQGEIFIWVYGQGTVVKLIKIARAITTRIPRRLTFMLSHIPASFLALLNVIYGLLNKFQVTKPLAQKVPLKEYSERTYIGKVNTAFDHLATPLAEFYRYEEIYDWFKQEEFKDFWVANRLGYSWRAYGKK